MNNVFAYTATTQDRLPAYISINEVDADPDLVDVTVRKGGAECGSTIQLSRGHILVMAQAILGKQCKVPPAGWLCTREEGHEGPCAAWPA